MTVKSDLQKAIAAAESAKGTYAMFAQSTEDQSAKQMFQSMSQDMDKHLMQLQSRLSYTSQASGAASSAGQNATAGTAQRESFLEISD
jgi:rubrerythrin